VFFLGAFLAKWMQCYIEEHILNQPPRSHPRVQLSLKNIEQWPKLIQNRFNAFITSKSIHSLTIYSHHIVLRYSLGFRLLSPLGMTNNHHQG
jgi:hypothetical protein